MIRIRAMTAADFPLALRLQQQAGWNQTEADWLRLLDLQPDGCFVAEVDGRPAATTIACILGSVAWLAMVLVDTPLRRRGVATALLIHALEFLDERGLATVRLDATPLGQPVYEKLGFNVQFTLSRYTGPAPAAEPVSSVRQATSADLDLIAELDQAVTGSARRPLLERLFRECPDDFRVVEDEGRLLGYAVARPGKIAVQIGPCVSIPEAAPLLLADAWRRHAGQYVHVDIPVVNKPAVRLAESRGLTVQRHLTRMCRGVPVREQTDHLWASSGPELG
jgi:ribosomal protein S18 acetylase RimI-like enzyme